MRHRTTKFQPWDLNSKSMIGRRGRSEESRDTAMVSPGSGVVATIRNAPKDSPGGPGRGTAGDGMTGGGVCAGTGITITGMAADATGTGAEGDGTAGGKSGV
jgi:hypothetical protein